jgi:plasmid rolling circle replication initiator protein Rep
MRAIREKPSSPIALAGGKDALGELSRHRRFNSAVARCLHSDPLTRDTALAIANCAQRLNLRFDLENGQLGRAKLVNGLLCNRRLCPFCEWRRTRAWRARLLRGLQSFRTEQPKLRALFLTLTVRNCQLYELRDTISHLHSSYKRLSLIRDFPTTAWFRRTEVTLSAKPGIGGPLLGSSAHPHIHALLLVRPSYFSRDYWPQLRWQQEWQMAARLDYPPVVDIRRAHSKRQAEVKLTDTDFAAVLEAAKYSTKAADLLSLGTLLPIFHSEMKHLRLYGVSRSLQRHIKEQEVVTDELLDEVSSDAGNLHFSAVAKWFDAIEEYQFTT